VNIFPLRTLTAAERRGMGEEAVRYGRFLGVPVTATIASARSAQL
jgi:hypothetical protein